MTQVIMILTNSGDVDRYDDEGYKMKTTDDDDDDDGGNDDDDDSIFIIINYYQ